MKAGSARGTDPQFPVVACKRAQLFCSHYNLTLLVCVPTALLYLPNGLTAVSLSGHMNGYI